MSIARILSITAGLVLLLPVEGFVALSKAATRDPVLAQNNTCLASWKT